MKNRIIGILVGGLVLASGAAVAGPTGVLDDGGTLTLNKVVPNATSIDAITKDKTSKKGTGALSFVANKTSLTFANLPFVFGKTVGGNVIVNPAFSPISHYWALTSGGNLAWFNLNSVTSVTEQPTTLAQAGNFNVTGMGTLYTEVGNVITGYKATISISSSDISTKKETFTEETQIMADGGSNLLLLGLGLVGATFVRRSIKK
jgi:hypothetical protein